MPEDVRQASTPPAQGENVPPDAIQVALGNIAQARVRLLKARASNPKEYDRLLKQSFPIDVLNMLEAVTVEYGNRFNALAYDLAELALAVEGEGEEDEWPEGEDAGENDDSDAGVAAARTVLLFVRALPDLPEDVKAAVAVLEGEGLLDDVDEEPAQPDEGQPSEGQPDVGQPAEDVIEDDDEEP